MVALICDVYLESGLSIPDAYLRIKTFEGNESNLSFKLSVYINKDFHDDEKPPITQINYNMVFDKDRNLFSQMYEYLRTLPEYTDAVEA